MIQEIFTAVIAMVIGAYIVQKLGFGNTTTTIYSQSNKRPSKVWKIIIIIGWIMFYFGVFYGLSWGFTEGFSSSKAIMGLSYCFLGFVILLIRKIKIALNRS